MSIESMKTAFGYINPEYWEDAAKECYKTLTIEEVVELDRFVDQELRKHELRINHSGEHSVLVKDVVQYLLTRDQEAEIAFGDPTGQDWWVDADYPPDCGNNGEREIVRIFLLPQ